MLVVVKRRRLGRPSTYATAEERLAAKREYHKQYMLKRRSQARIYSQPDCRANRNDAEFDPLRDGPTQHRDLTGFLLGDPPIGRSALDKRPH